MGLKNLHSIDWFQHLGTVIPKPDSSFCCLFWPELRAPTTEGAEVQNWALFTFETLASTLSGVTSPTTVTFFAGKSMLNDVTPARMNRVYDPHRHGPNICRSKNDIEYFYAYFAFLYTNLPFWRGVSWVSLHSLCSAVKLSEQQPACHCQKMIQLFIRSITTPSR